MPLSSCTCFLLASLRSPAPCLSPSGWATWLHCVAQPHTNTGGGGPPSQCYHPSLSNITCLHGVHGSYAAGVAPGRGQWLRMVDLPACMPGCSSSESGGVSTLFDWGWPVVCSNEWQSEVEVNRMPHVIILRKVPAACAIKTQSCNVVTIIVLHVSYALFPSIRNRLAGRQYA